MTRRVVFDFDIRFTNGGGIQGQEFRLDIPGDTIADKDLADYIVWDMRLLMVGQVKILNKRYINEPHKRTPVALHPGDKLVDLSHSVFDGLVTYKGLPAPVVCDYLSREDAKKIYEDGSTVQIGKIEMVANTGTYVDCPFHFYEDGKDLAQMPLDAFVNLQAATIQATDRMEIDADLFRNIELRKKAVLVHTGWSKHWNTEAYFSDHPFLTAAAASYLVECGVKMVGIDSHNIDDTRGGKRPVHSTLLRNEIPIVEHMCNLHLLPNAGFTFSAIPPKFKGVGTFPVRAFAKV